VSEAVIGRQKAAAALFVVLCTISFCHFVNDLAQSLLPAIYPIVKSKFSLDFSRSVC
jgi:MFS transporter, FSR family, fosmidomycin resistance protein